MHIMNKYVSDDKGCKQFAVSPYTDNTVNSIEHCPRQKCVESVCRWIKRTREKCFFCFLGVTLNPFRTKKRKKDVILCSYFCTAVYASSQTEPVIMGI